MYSYRGHAPVYRDRKRRSSVGSVVAFVGAVAAVFMIDLHMPVVPGIILTLVGLLVGSLSRVFHCVPENPAVL